MRRFQAIAGTLRVRERRAVPGEHDAGLDGGTLFRETFGPTHYAFDHKGVHFVALDNVSRARPELGAEQVAWLRRDLARFPRTAPIVVFTHRPLFDLKPEWEWFTSDGDEALRVLAPFENVTVLYGHIHREDDRVAPSMITLDRGQPVTLRVRSLDVTHGLFLRPLGIDATLEPGKVVELTVTPANPGRFTAICDHFCGAGHGNMKLTIEVR
jgi:3',5'-cyclic AMP phosphodiesterase CpdA